MDYPDPDQDGYVTKDLMNEWMNEYGHGLFCLDMIRGRNHANQWREQTGENKPVL